MEKRREIKYFHFSIEVEGAGGCYESPRHDEINIFPLYLIINTPHKRHTRQTELNRQFYLMRFTRL